MLKKDRLNSLDGLRGAAAASVMLHHAVIIAWPRLRDSYTSAAPIADAGSATWWATYTPVHLLWLGAEAVFVFFVLSGVVLALPVLRNEQFNWRRYYPSRAVRIYLPAIASLLLSIIVTALIFRYSNSSYEGRVDLLTVGTIARDGVLVSGVSHINGVLWSLQWELLFSFFLPLYVIFARHRASGVIKLALLIAAAFGGRTVVASFNSFLGDSLFYMSMFAAGAIVATGLVRGRRPYLAGLVDRGVPWAAIWLIDLLLLSAHWVIAALGIDRTLGAADVLSFLGALLLVVIALEHPSTRRVLENEFFQWLGMVSFSLYLVHAVILEAVAATLGEAYVFPVGLPVAVVVSVAFYHVLEAPIHRLSQRMKRGRSVPAAA